jgi:hypothetical protein
MKKVYELPGRPQFEHDFDHVEQKTVENDLALPESTVTTHIRVKVKPVPLDYYDVLGKELCAEIKDGNRLFYQTFYSDVR